MKRVFLLLLCLLLLGCTTPRVPVSEVTFACDTVVTVTAYAKRTIVEEAVAYCEELEKVLSRTVEGSDVWNINHADGKPVAVSDETRDVLTLALAVAAQSNGAFDPTIAGASTLWDFDADQPVLPDPALLSEAVRHIDYRKVQIDGNTVTLPKDMQLDLGGVAKGYIADRVAHFLRERGVTSALLDMGGNIVAIGTKPNGEQWTVAVRDPFGTPQDYLEILQVCDQAVVTSGNYERCFVLDGVLYHHILDPKTGMPVQNGTASVTIIAESSALADALTTACFVLGEKDAQALLEHYGLTAIFH